VSEPEDLILEGAHFATRLAREAWRRHTPVVEARGVRLASVRTRLELFVSAIFAAPVAIRAIEPPPPGTWLSWLAAGRGRSPRRSPICASDGQHVYLTALLNLNGTDEDRLAMYRLLAVGQSARIFRDSQRAFTRLKTGPTRDLFRIADGAVIDRWIAVNTPGLTDVLVTARSLALAQRDPGQRRHRDPAERTACRVLQSDPRVPALDLPDNASAEQCASWAQRQAREYDGHAPYQPLAPIDYWGELVEQARIDVATPGHHRDTSAPRGQKPRVAEMPRRPRPRQASDDEDDPRPGSWVIRADDPQESVEDPFGLQRPADRDHDADAEGLGDSLSELPQARIVRTPEPVNEVLRSGERLDTPERDVSTHVALGAAIAYPEWDYRTKEYRLPGAVVRQPAATLGDAAWVVSSLARHAGLVRRVRSRFERLRPRPVRLFRQIDGADVDIAAYVTTVADRRAGLATDGRLYAARRPVRRELAVALLLDCSASTDAWVSANRRIVDVEKEAMLVVCEALDALGDRYALFAFSGECADDVRVLTLKAFSDSSGLLVRRRVAALDSDGYTRLGASVRHVTAMLCRENAASRLLLLLSDGKPNDVDAYEGRYGIEDTRQAVVEARRQGIAVFCLTVDREAPKYAGRIFGRAGVAVLEKAEQLPAVVVEVLRHLIRA
jgi:nitric oxide reductase NorD protein